MQDNFECYYFKFGKCPSDCQVCGEHDLCSLCENSGYMPICNENCERFENFKEYLKWLYEKEYEDIYEKESFVICEDVPF